MLHVLCYSNVSYLAQCDIGFANLASIAYSFCLSSDHKIVHVWVRRDCCLKDIFARGILPETDAGWTICLRLTQGIDSQNYGFIKNSIQNIVKAIIQIAHKDDPNPILLKMYSNSNTFY